MTFEELKTALNSARKARESDSVRVLSTLVGALTANAKMVDGVKVISEEDVTAALKKHLKGVQETLTFKDTPELRGEENFIKGLLPVQLTEEDLAGIWEKINPSNMGEFMKYLKENHFGQYDGKMASNFAKSR